MARVTRWLTVTGIAVLALVATVSAASAAFPLRSPQVVFNYGPLQAYLNVVDAGINVATAQLNAQVWASSISGNADFTLMLRGIQIASHHIQLCCGIVRKLLPADDGARIVEDKLNQCRRASECVLAANSSQHKNQIGPHCFE